MDPSNITHCIHLGLWEGLVKTQIGSNSQGSPGGTFIPFVGHSLSVTESRW